MKITRVYKKDNKVIIKGINDNGIKNHVKIDTKCSTAKKILETGKFSSLSKPKKDQIKGALNNHGANIIFKKPKSNYERKSGGR